jgi:hypothetical protein
MLKRLRVAVVRASVLATVACGSQTPDSQARTFWPSRGTPLNSTLGWFEAINAHDRRRLLFYVAPSARDMMGWARPSVSWSRFTQLRCRRLTTSTRSRAEVYCTFHESASPTEGNPDSFWNVELRRTDAGWLIDNYGQG